MISNYPHMSGDPSTDRAILNLAHAIWDVIQVIQQIKPPQKELSFSVSEVKTEDISLGKLALKPAEVADMLSISRNRVYELVQTKQIPSIRFGKSIRIPRKALDQWIGEHQSAKSQFLFST